jgi:hypothetical protein
VGDFDECQIDKSGRWLVIKETRGAEQRLWNRIIDLDTQAVTERPNNEGAVGHSDCGFDCLVGETGYGQLPGTFLLWDLKARTSWAVYAMPDPSWQPMTRHFAHGNARPGDPRGQWGIVSSAHRHDLPRANEIVKVMLDGGGSCAVIAPNLVDLDAPGGGDTYRKLPHAARQRRLHRRMVFLHREPRHRSSRCVSGARPMISSGVNPKPWSHRGGCSTASASGWPTG